MSVSLVALRVRVGTDGTRFCSRSPNIIIAPVDIFDYSGGEPPENFLTVLRALEVRPISCGD